MPCRGVAEIKLYGAKHQNSCYWNKVTSTNAGIGKSELWQDTDGCQQQVGRQT